eukprot:2840680-Lingulodinium_polyedra.AAC.1
MAAVQLAVLKADHGATARPPRVKRKRAEVRRGMGRPCAKARPRPQAAPAPRPPGPPPPGCHELVKEGGLLSCTACGRSAQRR